MSKSKEEIEEFFEYVIKSIGKRIPKKPDVSAYNEDVSLLMYKCPSCASPYDVDYDGQYDYCPIWFVHPGAAPQLPATK